MAHTYFGKTPGRAPIYKRMVRIEGEALTYAQIVERCGQPESLVRARLRAAKACGVPITWEGLKIPSERQKNTAG